MKTETYPRVTTSRSLSDVVGIIKAEGDNKTYMSGWRRLGAAMQPGGGVEWFTPDSDPFAAAHELGSPTFGVGIHGIGWSALFYVWDRGDSRIFEATATKGVDSAPARALCERISGRLR